MYNNEVYWCIFILITILLIVKSGKVNKKLDPTERFALHGRMHEEYDQINTAIKTATELSEVIVLSIRIKKFRRDYSIFPTCDDYADELKDKQDLKLFGLKQKMNNNNELSKVYSSNNN